MKIKSQVWNKLVRDRIPEIIEKNGGVAETKVLGKKDYLEELLVKLEEEVKEVRDAGKDHLLEELGDVETVIEAIMEVNGWSLKDLEKQKLKKDKERGKFMKKLFLKSTKERDSESSSE